MELFVSNTRIEILLPFIISLWFIVIAFTSTNSSSFVWFDF